MIDVAMGMHYLSERGLIHRVCDLYTMDNNIIMCTIIIKIMIYAGPSSQECDGG